jgi:very-short-patch-repair endonuclease
MSVLKDYEVIAKFCKFSKSKKEWVFDNRERLIQISNCYERTFAKFLDHQKIEYIQQAPFDIDGEIYFLDFYIPKIKKAIEIDGSYHDSIAQQESDKHRDSMFKGIGIETIRIRNEEVGDKVQLDIRLKYFIDRLNNKEQVKVNGDIKSKKRRSVPYSLMVKDIQELVESNKIYSVSLIGSNIKKHKTARNLIMSRKIRKSPILKVIEDKNIYQIGNVLFSTNYQELIDYYKQLNKN